MQNSFSQNYLKIVSQAALHVSQKTLINIQAWDFDRILELYLSS